MKGESQVGERIRCRNMMYTQQVEYCHFKEVDTLVNHIESVIKPSRFAVILHDKDINNEEKEVAPHYHVVLEFENARSISKVAKLLKDSPQHIEKWDKNVENAYSYLIHDTEKAREEGKYLYDPKEVVSNFDFENELIKIKNDIKRTKSLGDKILLDGILSGQISAEQAKRQLNGYDFARLERKIEAVAKEFALRRAQEWRQRMKEEGRRIEVIWIYGASGRGKSKLSKDYASKLTDKYFESGSGRDPFQRYNGEEVIILDELRPYVFEYSDLLKMFDPFNMEIMGASRYYDKALTAHTIIVNSPYNPKKFYDKIHENRISDTEIDSFEQFRRRLSVVICVSSEAIYETSYDFRLKEYVYKEESSKKNPYYSKEKVFKVEESVSAEVFGKVTEDFEDADPIDSEDEVFNSMLRNDFLTKNMKLSDYVKNSN